MRGVLHNGDTSPHLANFQVDIDEENIQEISNLSNGESCKIRVRALIKDGDSINVDQSYDYLADENGQNFLREIEVTEGAGEHSYSELPCDLVIKGICFVDNISAFIRR